MLRRAASAALVPVAAVLTAVFCSQAGAEPARRGMPASKIAAALTEAGGLSGGLVVHLGCGDGSLTAALRAGDGYLVHGLDTDSGKIANARRRLRALGCRGQVAASVFDGRRLPFIENLVNLMVCERTYDVPLDEIMRVLAPNGVALVKGGMAGVAAALRRAQHGGTELVEGAAAGTADIAGEKWAAVRKPRPATMDEWTHFFYDASGNPASKDAEVDVLRRYQWIAEPRWARHHEHTASMSALVSSGGRVFYVMDDGPRSSVQLPADWNLYARDAFSGTLLWKRPILKWITHIWPLKSGPAQVTRRLVADGLVDGMVFAAMGIGEKVSILEARTGERVRTCDGTDDATEIICSDGALFVVTERAFADLKSQKLTEPVGWDNKKVVLAATLWRDDTKQSIVAVDARTGRELWRRPGPVSPMTLLAGKERVYYHDGANVVALDRGTGSEAWRVGSGFKTGNFWRNSGPRMLVHEEAVILSVNRFSSMGARDLKPGVTQEQLKAAQKKARALGRRGRRFVNALYEDRRLLAAFDRRTGRLLWKGKPEGSGHESTEDLFVVDGLVWTSNFRSGATGLDPRTGEVRRTLRKDIGLFAFHQRCYPSKAVGRYVLSGNPGIEFVDLRTGKWTPHHWTRGGCVYGVMPANGLVYAPPHPCACYLESKTSGFSALAKRSPALENLQVVADADRLEKGPAYGKAAGPSAAGADDWPTYRSDGARSGYTRGRVPEALEGRWQVALGGKLTAPVVCGGRVFLADSESHTLFALDAATGDVEWRFSAGGRIDSPPTIHEGKALFGCHDGWVYALRALEGDVVWRFRGAPVDRRMTAFDQVESVWPIHGSVLVHPLLGEGALYCVAGRSMFLDGGLRFLKLDPDTGTKMTEVVLDEINPHTGESLLKAMKGLGMPPALPDILSTNGRNIFMRSETFDLGGVRPEIKTLDATTQDRDDAHLFSAAGFLDGSWFHRSYWQYGKGFESGCNFWFFAGRNVPAGKILVFDGRTVYGYGRKPAYMVWTSAIEYQLFAAAKRPDMDWIGRKAARQNVFNRAQRLQLQPGEQSGVRYKWQKTDYPIMVRAMALADEQLVVAGIPDLVDEEKLFYGFDSPRLQAKAAGQARAMLGAKGSVLRVVSTADGDTISELSIGSAPVWDGMAVAGGKVFLATLDGKVHCFAGR